MEVIKTAIDGVVIIEPKVFKDARGYFFESFSQREFEEKVRKINFVQDNESKADKFVRLGEYRVNKVIDAIGRLKNLSNRTNYEYTQEQVEAMFSIMEKRLLEVKGRFAPKKEKEDTFSFGRKAE